MSREMTPRPYAVRKTAVLDQDRWPILHATIWVVLNLLGVAACLGALALVGLAVAAQFDLVDVPGSTLLWGALAEAALVLVVLAGSRSLSQG